MSHSSPRFLAGGRILFRIRTAKPDTSGIYATSLANPREIVKLLTTNSGFVYAAGHLLWLRGSTLVAQRFDPERLQLSGEPTAVADPVGLTAFAGMNAAAAGEVLLYGSQSNMQAQLTWFDHSGKVTGTLGEIEGLSTFRLSPDGRRVVSVRQSGGADNL